MVVSSDLWPVIAVAQNVLALELIARFSLENEALFASLKIEKCYWMDYDGDSGEFPSLDSKKRSKHSKFAKSKLLDLSQIQWSFETASINYSEEGRP